MSIDNDFNPNPVVSVIMAVHYDVKLRYLTDAISSILNQDVSDYELIIIADGSLFEEQNEFLSTVVDENKNVSLIQLWENVGPGAARNIGVNLAKGKYVAIMDSDDISMPHRLRMEIDFLNKNNDIAVVGSACEIINENGMVTGHRCLPEHPDTLRKLAPYFCPLNNPSVMGRIEVFKKYQYDRFRRNGEDYRLWLRLLNAKFKIANIKEPLVKFRVDSHMYKRRVGYQKAKSDLMNRIYAAQNISTYRRPFVYLFAYIIFAIRLLPHRIVRVFTNFQQFVFKKLKK